jgi:hypothetical protein
MNSISERGQIPSQSSVLSSVMKTVILFCPKVHRVRKLDNPHTEPSCMTKHHSCSRAIAFVCASRAGITSSTLNSQRFADVGPVRSIVSNRMIILLSFSVISIVARCATSVAISTLVQLPTRLRHRCCSEHFPSWLPLKNIPLVLCRTKLALRLQKSEITQEEI